MLARVCHDGLREVTLPFDSERGMLPAILKWGLRYPRASPRAATDRVPLRLSLAHAMHPRHRNLMLNIEHLTARVGQLRDGGASRNPFSIAVAVAELSPRRRCHRMLRRSRRPPQPQSPRRFPAPIKPPIARWSRSWGFVHAEGAGSSALRLRVQRDPLAQHQRNLIASRGRVLLCP